MYPQIALKKTRASVGMQLVWCNYVTLVEEPQDDTTIRHLRDPAPAVGT